MTSNPKLRWPIEMRIERVGTDEVLYMNCPYGIISQPLILVRAVAPIVAALDGTKSVDQLLEQFKPYGLQRPLLDQLLTMLEEQYFLETERFHGMLRQTQESYRSSLVRPAALAGGSYPASGDLLAQEIGQWLAQGTPVLLQPGRSLVGLIAPHIDYRRGGLAYGRAYRALEPEDHDLFIVIGTAHQYSRNIFHLTRKDFETPLGILPCDREFVDLLASRYGVERSFADEFLHRREHSLELQLPFLAHLKRTPRIVPILVGGFQQMFSKSPAESAEYDEFAASLAEAIGGRRAQGERVCVLLGVDMAHVGGYFGDQDPLSPERMDLIRLRDEAYLAAVERQDKKALWDHIAEDSDARRICGYPTIYTIIDVFDRLGLRYEAKLFDYRQAVDYERSCAVTFAGMGLYQ